MVSLLSTSTEYVLAESTQTLSLQYDTSDDEGDALWIGTSSFPRAEGLNTLAVRKWHRAREPRDKTVSSQHYYTEGQSPHWFIISDILYDEECDHIPFVKDAGRFPLRFFCSIPIRSQHGSVLGCLSILDSKPRFGVSLREMEFMEDMTQTIMKHLSSTRSSVQQQRSERLIQALGLFNTGQGTLRDWWLQRAEAAAHKGRGHRQSAAAERSSRHERLNDEFGEDKMPEDFERARSRSVSPYLRKADTHGTSLSFSLFFYVRYHLQTTYNHKGTSYNNNVAARVRDSMHVASQDFGPPTVEDQSEQEPESQQGSRQETVVTSLKEEAAPESKNKTKSDKFDLAGEIDSAYSRASNLIREALSAEGALFLDASLTHAQRPRSWRGLAGSTTGPSDAPSKSASETDTDAAETADRRGNSEEIETCPTLGFSTRIKASLRGFLPSQKHMGLSKEFLDKLICRYPQGKIFSFDQDGGLYSSSGEEGSSASDEKALATEMVRKVKRSRSRAAKEAAVLANILSDVQSVAFLPLWCVSRWLTPPLTVTYFADWASRTVSATVLLFLCGRIPPSDCLIPKKTSHISALSETACSPRLLVSRLLLPTEPRAHSFLQLVMSFAHHFTVSSLLCTGFRTISNLKIGILGGVELLQGTQLDVFQKDMTSTVKMAGTTLLDT